MRLSPNKIEFLAEEILTTIEKSNGLHIETNADLVYRVIADVIFENMQTEEELEAEVDELLQQYQGHISAMEMDYGSLRAKMKRELAKKKNFIL